MADKIYLETTELENIASGLKTKSNSISEIFKNSCYSALQMCSNCLEITGLDTAKFFDSFNNIYSNISIRCDNLSKFITENIIPSYNDVSNAITNNFNSELGDKISSLFGITAGAGSALGITENASSTQTVQSSNEEEPKIKETEEKPIEEDKVHEVKEEKQTPVNTTNNNVANEVPTEVKEEPQIEVVSEQEKVVETPPIEIIEEPKIENPMLSDTIETVEDIVSLETTESLLASDVSSGTLKKGLGVGLGLAGAATAAGVTSYTINSNNRKAEEAKDRNREKIDSKTFLEREKMTI